MTAAYLIGPDCPVGSYLDWSTAVKDWVCAAPPLTLCAWWQHLPMAEATALLLIVALCAALGGWIDHYRRQRPVVLPAPSAQAERTVYREPQ